jgi:hypothetical protein
MNRAGVHARREQERSGQCATIRCIIGNPFRPAPVLSPPVSAWKGSVVRRTAERIYAANDFRLIPVLADAIEDAGCADPDLLGHLRGPGPHVRGCWAVDLVLGRA